MLTSSVLAETQPGYEPHNGQRQEKGKQKIAQYPVSRDNQHARIPRARLREDLETPVQEEGQRDDEAEQIGTHAYAPLTSRRAAGGLGGGCQLPIG